MSQPLADPATPHPATPTRPATAAPGAPTNPLRNGPLLVLMLGHFTVDCYVGVIPVLYPLLIHRFDLNLATVGLVTLAYNGTASLSQPLFGWLADRHGTRLTGLSMAWTALLFAATGFAPSFPALVAIAAVAGLGSGAFHPFGAIAVSEVLPQRNRTTGMSVYVTGGTIGVALGPLIGILAFSLFGIHGTALLLIPGVTIAAVLIVLMRGPVQRDRRHAAALTRSAAGAVPWLLLAVVTGVMMSRSWTVLVLEVFTPTWYRSLGYPASFYGPLATTIVLASAAGTVGVGGLADRYGKRTLILVSLVVSVPVILLYSAFTGPIGFLTGALVGLLAASTAPLMLLMAQQLMAGRAGLASGLVLGLGFVAGAIGAPITGAIADHTGLGPAMALQAVIVVLTIPIAWLLPSEDALREHAQRTSRAALS